MVFPDLRAFDEVSGDAVARRKIINQCTGQERNEKEGQLPVSSDPLMLAVQILDELQKLLPLSIGNDGLPTGRNKFCPVCEYRHMCGVLNSKAQSLVLVKETSGNRPIKDIPKPTVSND